MRHPLEEFVKAEIAYRADPRNPGFGSLGARRRRRLGRGRRGRSPEAAQVVAPVPAQVPAPAAPVPAGLPAPAPASAAPPVAVIRPFPRAPRRPDAA